jgi:hypothetical protein
LTRADGSENDLAGLRAVRLADWTEREGRVVLERPMPPGRGVKGLLRRISALTGVKHLRLDELGTFVWRRLDGEANAAEIARALHDELESEEGGGADEAGAPEERVERFLNLLRREGLVGFPGVDDEAIAARRGRAVGNSP